MVSGVSVHHVGKTQEPEELLSAGDGTVRLLTWRLDGEANREAKLEPLGACLQ